MILNGVLQWGHGLIAVERVFTTTARWGRTEMLQWGHGLIAVESQLLRTDHDPFVPLQWGHGLIAVERTFWRPVRRPSDPRFNGATA